MPDDARPTLARPPQHVEVEERLLGAMLTWDRAVDVVIRLGLVADDLYRPEHRPVFDTILELRAAGLPHTPVDVWAEAQNVPDRWGVLGPLGATFLQQMAAQAGMAEWAEADAARVLEAARRRRLMDQGLQLHYLAAQPEMSFEALAGRLAEVVDMARPVSDRHVPGGTFALDAPVLPPALWADGFEIAWAEGESLMLVGPQGVGKTTLGQRVALGRLGLLPDVLGMEVVDSGGRLLYLACDRPSQARRSLRRMVGEELREPLDERLVVWQGPPPGDMGADDTLLLTLARRFGCDTVLVDSIKDVVSRPADDEHGACYNRGRQRALAGGVQLLELHHQRKHGANGGKPRTINDVYGSVFITAGAGSVLLLWGEPGDPVVDLEHLKQPVEPVGPLQLLHNGKAGEVTVSRGPDPEGLLKGGQSVADVARLMFDLDRPPTRKEVERARRKLESWVDKGQAVKKEGQRGGSIKTPTLYYPASHQPEPDP